MNKRPFEKHTELVAVLGKLQLNTPQQLSLLLAAIDRALQVECEEAYAAGIERGVVETAVERPSIY